MGTSGISTTARRLRWVVWVFWGCIVAAYIAGRFGLSFDYLSVRARASVEDAGPLMIVADITMNVVSMAPRFTAGTSGIHRVQEVLALHSHRKLTLTTLARLAGVSTFHLSRSFKAATGRDDG